MEAIPCGERSARTAQGGRCGEGRVMGRPTIQDVAREARVGMGTASRALDGNPHVADGTRERVRAAAERLGYRPSRAAGPFPWDSR